jgi:hypothetical protein
MTSAQILAEVKLRLGNTNLGFTDVQLYTYISKAKEQAEDDFPISYKHASVKTTDGDQSITLNSTSVNITSGSSVNSVFEYGVVWDDNLPMLWVPYKDIKHFRETSGSGGSEPRYFSVWESSGTLTLDVWPDITETIATFADAKLRLDLTERTADIDADTNPASIIGAYCHGYIASLAAYQILCDVGDERRFILRSKDRFRPGTLDLLERKIQSRANRETSGTRRLGKSVEW